MQEAYGFLHKKPVKQRRDTKLRPWALTNQLRRFPKPQPRGRVVKSALMHQLFIRPLRQTQSGALFTYRETSQVKQASTPARAAGGVVAEWFISRLLKFCQLTLRPRRLPTHPLPDDEFFCVRRAWWEECTSRAGKSYPSCPEGCGRGSFRGASKFS